MKSASTFLELVSDLCSSTIVGWKFFKSSVTYLIFFSFQILRPTFSRVMPTPMLIH